MKKIEETVKALLREIGEDPRREGLLATPKRAAESYQFLTQGYGIDPYKMLQKAIFNEKHDEMVVLKDIVFYSLCEHHLLPFFGKAHVAYIPDKRVVGLSKMARLVDVYARRLQVQERMTQQIAHTLQDTLKPKGTAVMIEAEHLCMQMRGVQKRGAAMVTSAMLGAFRKSPATRAELMAFIRNGH